MWPFKRQEPKPIKPTEPDRRIEQIEELKSWRDIGQTFSYLGRTCVVTGHWRIEHRPIVIGYGIVQMPDLRPSLRCDYADENGVIHSISFGIGELETLKTMNA